MDASGFGLAVGVPNIQPMGQGSSGVIMTHDGGQTWVTLPPVFPLFDPVLPSYTHFRGVCIVNSMNAWLVGDSATVYVTSDGGYHWLQMAQPYDSLKLSSRPTVRDVHFINRFVGVVVGGDMWTIPPGSPAEPHPAQAFMTTDGGITWRDRSPTPAVVGLGAGALYSVHCNGGDWFASGEFGIVVRISASAPTSKVTVVSPPASYQALLEEMFVLDQDNFITTGRSTWPAGPTGYRTVNNGSRIVPFLPSNYPASGKALPEVYFIDPNNGWVGVHRQFLDATTDGGASWTKFSLGSLVTLEEISGMTFTDVMNGWACGGDPKANTSYMVRYYGRPPKADISTSDQQGSWGTVTCEKSVETKVVLRSSGTGALQINAGDITFNTLGVEIVGNPFPITIDPKKFKEITVRWYPSSVLSGDFGAIMTVNSNDPDHNPWQINLHGYREYGYLQFDPSMQLSYGTCLGDTALVPTPVLAIGNRAPTFIDFQFVSGHNDFTLRSPKKGTIVKNTEYFDFRFVPADSGKRSGIYRFIHGNPSCPDTSLVEFNGLGNVTIIQPSVSVVDFGDVCINTVKDTTITLKNLSNQFASVGPLEWVSGDALFESPDFGVFLKQDSSKIYRLRFTPYKSGSFQGTYRLVAGYCPDTTLLTFRGKGITTEVSFSPKGPVTMGPIFVNRVATQVVTITNSGKTPARITSIEMLPSHPELVFTAKPTLPLTLQPNQAATVGLRFSPRKLGEFKTHLKVEFDYRCSDSAVLEITGLCVPNPQIEAPKTLFVGTQTCDAPLRDTTYIRNLGNGPLVFYSVSVSGINRDDFRIISPAINDTARAKDSIRLIVEMNRPTVGRSDAILRFTHNDVDAGRTDIDVYGLRTVSEFIVEGDSATEFFTRLFLPETRPFAVRNPSAQAITIKSITVTKEKAVFSVQPSKTLPVTLAPGASLPFDVTFTPNARGPFNAVVTLVSDPCDYTALLNLTGSGDTDGLSPDKGELDFVMDPCSYTTQCQDIVLKNLGPEPVEVRDLALQQNGSTFAFNPVLTTPFLVGPNAEQHITVCASPARIGKDAGTLVISSNDPAYPTMSIPLTYERDSSNVDVSVSSIDFGRLADCNASVPQRVVVSNTGTLNETLNAQFTGSSNAFGSTLVSPVNLKPGETAAFDLSFSRPSYGSFSDVYQLVSARCGEVLQVAVSGELVNQEYVATPNPLNFPTVNVGGTASRQLTVINNGGFDATIATITIQPAGVFTVPAFPPTISAGGTEVIDIRFSPTSQGSVSATACIIISTPCPDTICVQLNGSGVRGSIEAHPSFLSFGTRAQCETRLLHDTIRNVGGGIITLMSSSIAGANPAAFALLNPIGAPEPLASGAVRVFDIRFDPALAVDGPLSASLQISTDDNVLPILDVPIDAAKVTMRVPDDQSVAFGLAEIGTPLLQTITLTNNGSVRFCYETLRIPAEVTMSPALPICLDPGESVDIDLTFTAVSSGSWNGRLVLSASQPCVDSTVVTMTGSAQEGSLTQTPTVNITATPWCEESDFSVTISNSYLEAATLEALSFTGADGVFFTIISPPSLPRTIASGGSLTVTARFSPQQADRVYGTNLVSTLRIFGAQVTRQTAITAESKVPSLVGTAIAFPPTVVLNTSAARQMTFTNMSDLPVHIDGISIVEPAFSIVSIVPALPVDLAPGAVITVSANFTPPVGGSYSDSLVAVVSSPCAFSTAAPVTGIGIPQPIVNATLSVQDITGPVDAVLSIPILLDREIGGAEVRSWTGSVRFNPSMLHLRGLTREGTASSAMTLTYTSNNGTVTINAGGGDAAAGSKVLVYMDFLVLVGNDVMTKIELLDDFDFTSGYATVAGRVDGSFTLDGYCLPDDRLILRRGALMLEQSRPNPVSLSQGGNAIVRYSIPIDGHVRLVMYDAMGREVGVLVDGMQTAGTFQALMPMQGLPEGVYFYRLSSGGEFITRRLVLTR